ncbi:helix-turn-helix transcriptional regulator [Streptosporangiaceae bacterium NEAU-GS5]|nr:helix-turn-helix transcriptional regulator [Streptosporangiaceae bacterium NEAU-GS5]
MNRLFRRRHIDGVTAHRHMRRVLLALLTDAGNLSLGTISAAAHVSAPRVVVDLAQLETKHWITSEWAPGPPPRRRFYRLTPYGWGRAYELLGLTPSEVRRGA